MATIEIPDPDFSFSDVIKRKAETFCRTYLSEGAIKSVAYGYRGNIENILNSIESECYTVRNDTDRLILVSELIIHLNGIKQNYKSSRKSMSNVGPSHIITPKQDLDFENTINDILYFVYNLSSSSGYVFDKNAFNEDEIDNIYAKIDMIISSLERVKVGQEVIYEFIEELKSDFESLKSDIPLGKKRWYQRAAGIVFSYASSKGADEVFEVLKPHLTDLIKQSPGLIDKLLK